MDMVPLEYLSRIIVTQGCSGGARGIEKQIHAQGKVCRVNQPAAVTLDQSLEPFYFSVPSGGAYDHALHCVNAEFDMADDTVRSSEINHHVNVA